MTDKNKALYKLANFPRVYYINLDDHTERKESMEKMLTYWGIENFTRISAHDGRGGNDLGEILKGKYPKSMTGGEVGCVTSHLKAMKHWLENTPEDEDLLVIMEDDCDINTAAHWGFTWRQFLANAPYHFDVLQLAVINPAEVHVKLHLRFVNDFSTACYAIRRHHAKKLVKLHCRGNYYKLDQEVKPRAVADDLIYNAGLTFVMPLFLYKIEMGSSIHDIHVNTYHKSSHDGMWQFWKTQANSIEKWEPYFSYDPYFGTLPPGVVEQQLRAKIAQEKPA